MRLEVVARIQRVIKDLWPNAEVCFTHTHLLVKLIVFLRFMQFVFWIFGQLGTINMVSAMNAFMRT